ncbi:hypothetical protein E3N88_14983 [Mikania micrantha]|uniref:Uncharacterized protein n=1 Tax=Mikania micrantha TaxID=192012 RepID=A0A5N6P4Y9_9ASTR|nr:hypothetical protein E3N88_14983 [Mikania micrantha]
MLHTEPSFSVYAEEQGLIKIEEVDLKIKDGSDEFSFAENLSGFENLGVVGKEDEEGVEPVSVNNGEMKFDGSGEFEDDCKKMVDQDPQNPVFLKNYAHLLQSNGDLNSAEEYYFRATQADPQDGETLMQYAKLVWELHHDQDRALAYFEAAVLAAPQDSQIHAAYASFMWEIDEDDNKNAAPPIETKRDLEGAEEYYLRALHADPGDGEVASQCAQLAWELHRDKDKASSYFEQALKADPTDSHVLAAYIKFLWEVDDEDHRLENEMISGLNVSVMFLLHISCF